MRNLILILFVLLFTGCNHSSRLKSQRLKDTLAALKKNYAFGPLTPDEAYAFINKYYLPRLDTFPTKRKIFLYPLAGTDFKELFKEGKAKLEKEYSGDTTASKSNVLFAPPPAFFDKSATWDSKKLLNTNVVRDTATLANSVQRPADYKTWHNKYGFGYMYISYPQYNPFTQRLVISEWLEDNSFCGTGKGRKLWFRKISGGWKAY